MDLVQSPKFQRYDNQIVTNISVSLWCDVDESQFIIVKMRKSINTVKYEIAILLKRNVL